MPQKITFIYFFNVIMLEITLAQNPGMGTNSSDTVTNHHVPDSLNENIVDPNKNSNKPTQVIANMKSTVSLNEVTNSPTIPEPIAASLANQEALNDLMRSARETMMTFGNSIQPTDSFIETTVSTNPLVDVLTSTAHGMSTNAAIGGPLLGAFGASPIVGNIPPPTREFIGAVPAPEVRVPIDPGAMGTMLTGTMDSPYMALNTANTAVSSISSSSIPVNLINDMVVANDNVNRPNTTPLLGELNNVGISNTFVNPISIGTFTNLPNMPGFPTDMLTKIPTLTGPIGFSPQGMLPNTARFPGIDLAASKSILASITGIDPASLGTNAKFRVKSASPFPPSGLTIQANNLLMEGKLAVTGKLPFLGAVNVDGVLPDSGRGTVLYESGNGNIGIMNEIPTMGSFSPNYGINMGVPNALINVATNRLL